MTSLTRRLESRLGLTRGDVTVALFLSLTAIGGFIYTTFLENPAEFRRRTELYSLIARSDSTVNARSGPHDRFVASTHDSDSVARAWDPLNEDDLLAEGTDGSGRIELTLEEAAPININTAPLPLLQLLPGIGEKTAEKIVAARPFRTLEELDRVKGIGEKKLAKLLPYITVGRVRVISDPSLEETLVPERPTDSAANGSPDDERSIDSLRRGTDG